jgi:hypothetical protein
MRSAISSLLVLPFLCWPALPVWAGDQPREIVAKAIHTQPSTVAATRWEEAGTIATISQVREARLTNPRLLSVNPLETESI